MTTLTITDAKKNLGKWLGAAVKGEDIGILAGATIVALRPVDLLEVARAIELRDNFVHRQPVVWGRLGQEFAFRRPPPAA